MGNRLIGTPVSRRWMSGIVISSVGVITGLMYIDHLLEDRHTMPIASDIMFPLCLLVVLLYAGYWLGQAAIAANRLLASPSGVLAEPSVLLLQTQSYLPQISTSINAPISQKLKLVRSMHRVRWYRSLLLQTLFAGGIHSIKERRGATQRRRNRRAGISQ
jgi:hypothetical protein